MKALFYSLHAAIWLHALPESRLAVQLKKEGNAITYVSCGKSFPNHCTSMSAFNVQLGDAQVKKDKICRECKKNAKLITNSFDGNHLELSSFLTDEDIQNVANLLADISPSNFLDFVYKDIPVGRIAAYEPILKNKKMTLDFNAAEWCDYLECLRNSLLSLMGFIKIIDIESPDVIFIYSPQYGVNGVAAEYALKKGKKVYFLEGSSSNSERYSALRLWSWGDHRLVNPALKYWDYAKDNLTRSDVVRVSGHVEELFKGKSFAVFSPPKQGGFSTREFFGVPVNSKLILASLSSFDEAYAAYIIGGFPERKVKSPVFSDQFEWISKTIEYLKDHSDIYLIIRLHPRDYPNKRDTNKSEQATVWERLFTSLPKNIVVNTPDQNISIYDLFKDIDLVITGWSATGVEALLHGVQVVTYDKYLPSYPSSIHLTGETEEVYFENLVKAINENKNPDVNILNAYKWLAVSFSIGTIRIVGPIDIGENWPNSFLFKVLRKLFINLIKPLFKRVDLLKGFYSKEDSQRFSDFLKYNKNSLYEVIDSNRFNKIDDVDIKNILLSKDNHYK